MDDAKRSPSLKTLVENTGPDAALLTLNNSGEVIAEEPPHSDSLDFVEDEFHQSEGLETEFNSSIFPTDEVRGRIHLAVEIGSVTLDACRATLDGGGERRDGPFSTQQEGP